MNTNLRNFLAVSVLVASTTMTVRIAHAQQPAQPAPAPQAQGTPVAPAAAAPAPTEGAETGPVNPEVANPEVAGQQNSVPGAEGTPAQPYDPATMGPRTASPEVIEKTLNPYGYWVVIPGAGRVWVPNKSIVGSDFRPYDRGHWSNTEYGWTWVSDYAWGWAPFHYGRWNYYPAYGYAWTPGYRWAPAWVTWRFGGGYVGWAPYGWTASWGYRPWVFVGSRYFLSNRLWAYSLGHGYVGTIWGRTAFIGGYRTFGGARFFAGPSLGLVRGWTGRGVGYGFRGNVGFRGNAGFRGTVGAHVGVNTRAGVTARSNIAGRGSISTHGSYSNRGSYSTANRGSAGVTSRGSYGNHGSYSRPAASTTSHGVSRSTGGARRR